MNQEWLRANKDTLRKYSVYLNEIRSRVLETNIQTFDQNKSLLEKGKALILADLITEIENS